MRISLFPLFEWLFRFSTSSKTISAKVFIAIGWMVLERIEDTRTNEQMNKAQRTTNLFNNHIIFITHLSVDTKLLHTSARHFRFLNDARHIRFRRRESSRLVQIRNNCMIYISIINMCILFIQPFNPTLTDTKQLMWLINEHSPWITTLNMFPVIWNQNSVSLWAFTGESPDLLQILNEMRNREWHYRIQCRRRCCRRVLCKGRCRKHIVMPPNACQCYTSHVPLRRVFQRWNTWRRHSNVIDCVAYMWVWLISDGHVLVRSVCVCVWCLKMFCVQELTALV